MPTDPDSLADALAAAARAINAPTTLPDTLDAIVTSARASIPGFDEVGISIVNKDGSIETLAGTGPLVWELDSLQYALGEGPCLRAMRSQPLVVAEDIRDDQRWPRFVPLAVEAGLKAQMALQLYAEESTLGGLNLYSTQQAAIDPDALHAAELFATHAALALGHARRESQLNEALESRTVLGQATGIVMERYRISSERAFQFIVRASSTSNIKARDVAAEIVESANHDYRT